MSFSGPPSEELWALPMNGGIESPVSLLPHDSHDAEFYIGNRSSSVVTNDLALPATIP
jgi:hypothetical protein